MKKHLWLLLFCLIPLAALAESAEDKKTELKPLVTKKCVKESPSGNCKTQETTFSVMGAHCTEDCVVFNSFDECKLNNSCKFDQDSRCFEKKSCVEVGSYNSCKKWETTAECL